MKPQVSPELYDIVWVLAALIAGADVAIFIRWAMSLLIPSDWEQSERAEPPRPPFSERWSLVHVFVAAQVMIGALLMIALGAALAGLVVPGMPGGLELTTNEWFIDGLTVLQNAGFVGVAAILLRQYGVSFREIGLIRPRLRQSVIGILLGTALFAAATGLEFVVMRAVTAVAGGAVAAKIKSLTESTSALTILNSMHSPGARLLLILMIAIFGPIAEEIFFRGLVYNAAKYRWNVTVGVVFSSLIFAVAHMGPIAVVVIFPMGICLAYSYERTRNFTIPMLMHITNNSLTLAAAYAFHAIK